MRLLPAILLPLVLWTAQAAAQPSLLNPGVLFPGFSPNLDRVQDTAVYFFTLAGDSAIVTVLVQQDSSGAPGHRIFAFDPDTVAVGPDTLQWSGATTAGPQAPEGKYWITAQAMSLDS